MEKVEDQGKIHKRFISGFLESTETASDGMKYTDPKGAKRRLFFGGRMMGSRSSRHLLI